MPTVKQPSQLDKYRETLTETRLKVLGNLEAAIKNEIMDPIEALDKLATIMLLPRPNALQYARTLGQAKLWKRAE